MQRTVLLCLHGWGGSKASFDALRKELEGLDLEILTPDLPGFGDEPEPEKPWTTDNYVSWVLAYLEKCKVQSARLLLLGHSHGGRIAINIAANAHFAPGTLHHLFLCAPAGIRHPRHFKRMLGLTLAKTGKCFLSIPGLKLLQPLGKKLLYKLVRVHDYEKASAVMRQTLINVSAEDLRPLLPQVTIPTDLFWGTEDGMTPYSDALVMKNAIPHCTLHTYEGVRHSVHKDRAKEIAQSVRDVL